MTLLELVVVLAILVVLSGMVVPLIEGLGHQTNASTNATVVSDVNGAVRAYHARFEDRYPNGWDSLLNASGALSSKLHSGLTNTSGPNLQAHLPTPLQVQSLVDLAGISTVYEHDDAVANSMLTMTASITTTRNLAFINPTNFSNQAFNLQNLDNVGANNAYVVLGLGPNTTIRSAVMTDVPLIQSADPTHNYARVLCVFMVPGGSATETFAAKYVGCFLPDGTSQLTNLQNYHNTAASN